MAKAKGKKPELTERDKDRRQEFALRICDLVSSLLHFLIVGATVVALVFVGVALPVYFSAGRETVVTYALSWLQNVKVDILLMLGVGGTGFAGWYLQYRKTIRERQERDRRLALLEEKLDPSRSSSGLNPEGTGEQGDD